MVDKYCLGFIDNPTTEVLNGTAYKIIPEFTPENSDTTASENDSIFQQYVYGALYRNNDEELLNLLKSPIVLAPYGLATQINITDVICAAATTLNTKLTKLIVDNNHNITGDLCNDGFLDLMWYTACDDNDIETWSRFRELCVYLISTNLFDNDEIKNMFNNNLSGLINIDAI